MDSVGGGGGVINSNSHDYTKTERYSLVRLPRPFVNSHQANHGMEYWSSES